MKKDHTFNPFEIAEVRLSYQTKVKAKRPRVTSSFDAAKIFQKYRDGRKNKIYKRAQNLAAQQHCT